MPILFPQYLFRIQLEDGGMILHDHPKTKAAAVYRKLRRAIVTLEIDSGEPLDESSLITQLGVSRTPLREAIKQLALEQLIIAHPHRAPYVAPFSLTDLQPLYETRLLLELPVARLAAERITAAELSTLTDILDSMRSEIDAGHVYEVIELDYRFHSMLANATHNRYLADAINQLNRNSLRLWYLAHSRIGLEGVASAHDDILRVLTTRDPAAAEEVMKQHVALSRDRVIRASVQTTDPT